MDEYPFISIEYPLIARYSVDNSHQPNFFNAAIKICAWLVYKCNLDNNMVTVVTVIL